MSRTGLLADVGERPHLVVSGSVIWLSVGGPDRAAVVRRLAALEGEGRSRRTRLESLRETDQAEDRQLAAPRMAGCMADHWQANAVPDSHSRHHRGPRDHAGLASAGRAAFLPRLPGRAD